MTMNPTDPFDQAQRDLAAWHSIHPRATLAEIEVAAEEQIERLRAHLLEARTEAGFCEERPPVPEVREHHGAENPEQPTADPAGGSLARPGAQLRSLSEVRGGTFPPWMSSWPCSRPPTPRSWWRRWSGSVPGFRLLR